MQKHLIWIVPVLSLTGLAVLFWLPHNQEKRTVGNSSAQFPSIAISNHAAPTTHAGSNSTSASEHVNQGTKSLEEGNVDAAIEHYQKAVALNPEDEDAHYNLGLAYARKGDARAAEEQYREALRIYPEYSEAHNNLGNLLAAQGKLEEAVTHLKEAVSISPTDAAAQNNLGTALAR